MDILIIGSLAYDSVESPEGNFENLLGGSATYAGLASSFHNLRQEEMVSHSLALLERIFMKMT